MAVITLTDAKLFLSITTTAKDALITAMIPEVQGFIVSYCNRTFLDSNGAEAWPAGMKLIASRMIGWNLSTLGNSGLSSESQGDYSYSKDTAGSGAYPKEILTALSGYGYISVGYGQRTAQAIDRRGKSLEDLEDGEYYQGLEGVPFENQ